MSSSVRMVTGSRWAYSQPVCLWFQTSAALRSRNEKTESDEQSCKYHNADQDLYANAGIFIHDDTPLTLVFSDYSWILNPKDWKMQFVRPSLERRADSRRGTLFLVALPFKSTTQVTFWLAFWCRRHCDPHTHTHTHTRIHLQITVIQLAVAGVPPVEPARGLPVTIRHPRDTIIISCGSVIFDQPETPCPAVRGATMSCSRPCDNPRERRRERTLRTWCRDAIVALGQP